MNKKTDIAEAWDVVVVNITFNHDLQVGVKFGVIVQASLVWCSYWWSLHNCVKEKNDLSLNDPGK